MSSRFGPSVIQKFSLIQNKNFGWGRGTNVGRKRRERVRFLYIVKISPILEDKHVRKKRGHICPEDTLRTIYCPLKHGHFFSEYVVDFI